MEVHRLKKVYYSIGEVSELSGVKQHVLRFWEKEFPQLRPQKGRSGNRLYRERDIRIILLITHLLYRQRYTIEGARKRMKDDRELIRGWLEGPIDELMSIEEKEMEPDKELEYRNLLREIKKDLEKLLTIVD